MKLSEEETPMCPACVASAAWLAAGVTSTGGLTALVARVLRSKNDAESVVSVSGEDEERKHDQTIKEK
jgi:hypothetical protein